jgi:hypothetical protein
MWRLSIMRAQFLSPGDEDAVSARVMITKCLQTSIDHQIAQVLICAMDPIKLRMRYLIGFFVAAVLTAAVLRHFLHVQVGFTREEIRSGVLITASIAIFFTAIVFRWRRL